MRTNVIRFATLYVFNVVVLFLIGLLMTSVRVGWHALWAAVILTLATLLVKPALGKAFRSGVERSAASRTTIGEKVVQYVIVFVVELIVWLITVLLSGVRVSSFWGWVVPPLLLLVAWVVYDLVDDRMTAKAGEIYDAAHAQVFADRSAQPSTQAEPATTATPIVPDAVAEARQELQDGLTPEQRRDLDGL
ncbi:MAG: hypothetical protein WA971_07370 [Microbacterium sp.]